MSCLVCSPPPYNQPHAPCTTTTDTMHKYVAPNFEYVDLVAMFQSLPGTLVSERI